MNGNAADNMAAGIGHNSGARPMPEDESGKAPSWATPTKLTLHEAAEASIGAGRYAHERRTLIEAIFDPRLGISPLPLQLLAAVIECINGKTGLAHPGGRYWAQRIVNYLNGIPAQYREGALKNAATVVRQAGYAVSEKRAAERGGRAIAHFAITCPTPEEKEAGIEVYLREKRPMASKVTTGMTSDCGHSDGDHSCGHPGDDLSRGCGHPGTDAEVTRGVKNRAPLSITEPVKRNPYTASSSEDANATLKLEDEPAQQAGKWLGTRSRKKRAAPRTQVAPDWRPTDELIAWVKAGWVATDRQIAAEADKFRDHHTSKGSLMADWAAAWRTWWRNGYHKIARRRESKLDAERNAADEMRAAYERILAEEESGQ
jgi:hypothetical protein